MKSYMRPKPWDDYKSPAQVEWALKVAAEDQRQNYPANQTVTKILSNEVRRLRGER